MNCQQKSKYVGSKKPMKQERATRQLTKAKSYSPDKTKQNSKCLKKCKTRAVLLQPKQVKEDKASKQNQGNRQSITSTRKTERKKSSFLMKSSNLQSAYYPHQSSKFQKIKTSRSKQSFVRVTSTKYSMQTERVLTRHNSKPIISENSLQQNYAELLAKTKNVLNKFRDKCTLLAKDNDRLKEQLERARLSSQQV